MTLPGTAASRPDRSHNETVRLSPAVAAGRPSGLIAMDCNAPWPVSLRPINCPLATSQTLMIPEGLDDTSHRPSGVNSNVDVYRLSNRPVMSRGWAGSRTSHMDRPRMVAATSPPGARATSVDAPIPVGRRAPVSRTRPATSQMVRVTLRVDRGQLPTVGAERDRLHLIGVPAEGGHRPARVVPQPHGPVAARGGNGGTVRTDLDVLDLRGEAGERYLTQVVQHDGAVESGRGEQEAVLAEHHRPGFRPAAIGEGVAAWSPARSHR